MTQKSFVIERTYNEPIHKVWKAISDKDQMKEWYFDLKEFKPEVGFEFQFEGGKDDKPYLHLCKIIEAEEGRKLKHSWRYDGYEGNSFVTWELFDENGKTRVKLTHEGPKLFLQATPIWLSIILLQAGRKSLVKTCRLILRRSE